MTRSMTDGMTYANYHFTLYYIDQRLNYDLQHNNVPARLESSPVSSLPTALNVRQCPRSVNVVPVKLAAHGTPSHLHLKIGSNVK